MYSPKNTNNLSKPTNTLIKQKENVMVQSKSKLIDRKNFFSCLKAQGLFQTLKQTQVDGVNFILNEWDTRTELTDIRWLAYMLATTYHETAMTMLPIAEYGKGKGKPYGSKIKMNRQSYSSPNKLYYGRGYVQLTWYENYDKMGRLLHVDLLNNPELAMSPPIAIKIMIEGMTKGDSNFGDFTGKSLEMYFNKTTNDSINARRIINGTDKAKTIANYHNRFLDCLV